MKLNESFERWAKGVTISPNLVSHERFHLCDWWKVEGSDWWWWSSENSPILRSKGIETVDESLKKIVSTLWKREIPTTPSCSGHSDFYSRRDSIHESIIRVIREGRESCFREEEKQRITKIEEMEEDWFDRVCDYQRRGVLGWKEGDWERGIKWESQVLRDRGCFILLTESSDEWSRIEELILNRLEEDSGGYPGESAPLSTQLYTQSPGRTLAI
jgi:hypothetical protein